jgi:hypothetical protein
MTTDASEQNESEASLRRLIADLDRELALDPTNALAHDQRGNAYFQVQEYQRAITDYTRALELDPQCAAAYQHRGQAFAALGYHQWAAADFSQAEALDLQKQQLVLPQEPVAHRKPVATTPIPAAPSGQRVYRLRYRLLLAVVLAVCFVLLLPTAPLFLVGAVVGTVQGTVPLWEGLLFLLFALILLAVLLLVGLSLRDIWQARLVIASEGITCDGNGYRVYTPWWNIRTSGSMQLGVRRVSGLLLGQPAVEGVSLAEGMRQQRPVLERSGWLRLEYKALPVLRALPLLSGLGEGMRPYARMMSSMIPISLFVRQWQGGEVARLIALYAPHVFGPPGTL